MKEKQTLKLFYELRAELSTPDAFWQILVLLLCLGLALLIARWWQGRKFNYSDRLHAAGTRAAMPLCAMILVALAQEALVGVMPVKLLAVAMPFLFSLLLVRICVYVLRQSFADARWLAESERWVMALVWIGLALHLSGLAHVLIAALERLSVSVGKYELSLWTIIKGSLTVLITVVGALWIAGVVEARLLRLQIDSSLRIVSVRVSKALLILVALLVGLSMVGIDITALSVFTGALGVGLGLGLQRIASNYVSGFIILLDRSIRLGNVVQLSPEVAGTVSEITTRYTVLRNLAGIEFLVPNELMVSNTVQNQSYSDTRVRVALRVGVSYSTPDIETVLRLMENVARQHARVIADPPPGAFMVEFGDSSILLELGFWISDPQAGMAGVRSDVALALRKVFQEKGIAIPFPQREVRTVAGND